MIRPCHCSFPRNTSTLGVRLALGAALLLLMLSAFWVWSTRPRDSRGQSLCDLCFHSKSLFSSRPITDSTNTLDFTSVQLKTFSITCADGHKCVSKGKLSKRLNSDWSNLNSGLIKDSLQPKMHGKSNIWSKFTVIISIFSSIGCF